MSEIRKKTPDAGAAAWFASVPADRLFLSVLVAGEIRQGIARLARRDSAQAQQIEHWLSQLIDGFGDRIVPITVQIAEVWGRLNVPDPVPVVDGLMAATALVHDWTLVTRNVHHVAATGAHVLNPFSGGNRPGTGAAAPCGPAQRVMIGLVQSGRGGLISYGGTIVSGRAVGEPQITDE